MKKLLILTLLATSTVFASSTPNQPNSNQRPANSHSGRKTVILVPDGHITKEQFLALALGLGSFPKANHTGTQNNPAAGNGDSKRK